MSTLTYYSVPSTAPGRMLNAFRCVPDTPPRAILQLTHGMVEYIGRYEQLARYLADRGILVVGHDHLGHGGSICSKEDYGYFAEPDGNRVVLDDIHAVNQWVRADYPGVPCFLLGHSMGSFYARQYICEWGSELEGAILMGTGWQPWIVAEAGRVICRIIAAFKGWRYRSSFVNNLAFGSYNKSFTPARTTHDWLNRDEHEVDVYLADERCTFCFTLNAYYALFTALTRLCDKKLLAKVPKQLPLLFLAGDNDPVGDRGKGVRRAAQSLTDAGVKQVTVKLYPGARHELLVELNRQEVFADIAAFLDLQLAKHK